MGSSSVCRRNDGVELLADRIGLCYRNFGLRQLFIMFLFFVSLSDIFLLLFFFLLSWWLVLVVRDLAGAHGPHEHLDSRDFQFHSSEIETSVEMAAVDSSLI